MHLMRCAKCMEYSMKKACAKCGIQNASAHPTRFSPDDQFSEQRMITKKRFGLVPGEDSK